MKTPSSTPPFSRVLAADRSEIVVRINSTLNRLNLESIAIYLLEDRQYLMLVLPRLLRLHPSGSAVSETYLNIEAIIYIAKKKKKKKKALETTGVPPAHTHLISTTVRTRSVS
jgi:pyruvate carboxylase